MTYIAQVCQVPLALLKQANADINDPDHIEIGDTVCVLSNCTDSLFPAAAAAAGAPASPATAITQGILLCPP